MQQKPLCSKDLLNTPWMNLVISQLSIVFAFLLCICVAFFFLYFSVAVVVVQIVVVCVYQCCN